MDELKMLKAKLEQRIVELDNNKQSYNAAICNVQIEEDKMIIRYIDACLDSLKKKGAKK